MIGVAYRELAPPTRRTGIRRIRAVGVLVVVTAIALATGAALGQPAILSSTGRSLVGVLPGAHRTGLGADDGAVPHETTVFADQVPGVANLDPALLRALRRAATEAGAAGVAFYVDSGWRSRRYQQRLLSDAISDYGSEAEARRWVATPGTSPHVSGDAVDLGPAAAAWLSSHGAAYGLCRIYRNEPWHYELRREAVAHGCPRPYPDPSKDPRLR